MKENNMFVDIFKLDDDITEIKVKHLPEIISSYITRFLILIILWLLYIVLIPVEKISEITLWRRPRK